MRFLLPVVMAASIVGLTTAGQTEEEKAKVDATKAQIMVLGKAVDAYRIKYDEFPKNLKALVEKELVLPEAIIDLWKKEYQYDVAGKRNKGKKPDIWVVTPSKVTIGNWLEKKKE